MTPAAQALYDADLADDGFVWNASRLHAYQPEMMDRLMTLAAEAFEPSGLSFRQRAILVLTTASTRGDSYCSLAWGGKLASAGEPDVAAATLDGSHAGLSEQERAMAGWARQVVTDPNDTAAADVQRLRDCGLDDAQIFAITAFVALRLAIATINDALGAHPDVKLAESLPPAVAAAVTYGRPPLD